MTDIVRPEEIVRDALARIRDEGESATRRIGFHREQLAAAMGHLAEAQAAEAALVAYLDRTPAAAIGVVVAPEPGGAAQPEPKSEQICQPEPVADAPEPQSEPEPQPEPAPSAAAPTAPVPAAPKPFDPVKDPKRALTMAKLVGPADRDEVQRHQLAAASMRMAFGLLARQAAAPYGINPNYLAPSWLQKYGIADEEVEIVAAGLRGDPAAVARLRALQDAAKAPAVADPAPEPTPAPSAELEAMVSDLLQDLPAMAATMPKGVLPSVLMDWFGWSAKDVDRVVNRATAQGAITQAENGGIRLKQLVRA